ncbi:MAG: tripartite tricarboxylate transporter TctB family protein [Pararhodobacter sp.]|nr:tripartite tricarboxylate transporter TctB family protein [Pararhodobacter sp.]
MSARMVDLIFLALLLSAGLVTVFVSRDLPPGFGGDIGPAAFPVALGWALVGLSGLAGLRTLALGTSVKAGLPGAGKIAVTIMAMAAFLLLWQTFGRFYLFGFGLMFGLLLFYGRDGGLNWRFALWSALGSAGFMGLAWLFFTHVLYVRF